MGWFSRHRPARVREQSPRSEREDALFALSRRLIGATGTSEIAQALFREIDTAFEIDAAVLLEISDDQSFARGVAAMGSAGAEVGTLQIDIASDTSALAQVVRTRSPHRVLDGERESLQNREIAALLNMRSALYVPLLTSAGVVAVAVIASTSAPRAFRHDDVEFIQKLSNDAAVAIERSRLAQALRDVGERELIVASVARSVRESLDQDDVLRTAVLELAEQCDADHVRIDVQSSGDLSGRTAQWAFQAVELSGWNAQSLSRSAQLALDDHCTVVARAPESQHANTEISVPLMHRDRMLGVLTIARSHEAFEPTEQRLIELICIEIAAAVAYVQLHARGRKHLDEQLALARAAQSLTADLRFDRVLEHIVEEVVKLLRTPSAAFYTYDRDERSLTLRAAFGTTEQTAVGQRMGLTGLAGRVVQSGVSQLTNDYEADLGGEYHPVYKGIRRAISVPLRWQGDLRGVISVAGRDDERLFTDHDVALMEAFADLASLALHNADAYSAHTRQARIQAGFYRISQVLSSSLARAQTLTALAQAATEALDGDWAVVIGGDGTADPLHVEAAWQAPDSIVTELDDPAMLARSTVSLAAEFERVVTSRELANDDRVSSQWRDMCARAGVASQIAVPVRVLGTHSAVVLVSYAAGRRFGDEELVVAGNLANTAAAALERAGLFENERRTRRLSEVLADVSALLAETLKTQTVLERIVDQAAVLLEVDTCFLSVMRGGGPDGSGDVGTLEVEVASGGSREEINVLPGTRIGVLVEEVARTRRTVATSDLSGETDAGGIAASAFLGVPLRHPRGHLIGVLSACDARVTSWTEAEVSALESFANSAAVAIRNAELYANMKRERDTVEKLLTSIAEGIVATDTTGAITIWNDAAERITGISSEYAVGRGWRDVLGLDADTRVPEGESVIEARPSGTPMWLGITAADLHERRDVVGSIYAFRDVSADYTLDRLKSDFIQTVSFVIRAPLASIHGFSHTLLREDVEFSDEDRRVFVGYIASETERLARIVDDLLQVARIDAGSVEVHVADCDASAVIDRAVTRVSDAHGREVHVSVADDMQVRADARQLQLVMANLLENAIRSSPEHAAVEIDAIRDNGVVQLRVIDHGFGVAPSEQKHLFTKFYISPDGRTDRHGTGLGLYISKGLISAMGGRIWVTSQPGSGSTFTVELPASHHAPRIIESEEPA